MESTSGFQDERNKLNAKVASKPNNPNLDSYLIERLKTLFLNTVQSLTPSSTLNSDDFSITLAPDNVEEHLTLDVFSLGKKLKTNPIELCQNITKEITSNRTIIQNATPLKGFLNFTLSLTALETVVEEITHLKTKYGQSNRHLGKVCVVDYSAPNIAKPIGVGHLRSTIIGHSLSNIYEANGYTTLKINHLGDWGTQFGALIYAYKNWVNEDNFEKDPINELKRIYVMFHAEKEKTPSLEDDARAHFKNLENNNDYERHLWETFRHLSIHSFESIYSQFNITFDAYLGESAFVEGIEDTIELIEKSPVSKTEEGSNVLVVEELEGLPTFLARKNDGSSLYITRDLAALRYRAEEFSPDTVLYVVGNEQHLHFKQLFALYNVLSLPAITHLEHIGFGLILTNGKKMSTRKGSLIELQSLIDEVTSKVKRVLEERGIDLSNDDIHKIAIACIIYNDLSRARTKDIEFNWEKMLSMDSGSSIYLQYTYARFNSILEKLKSRKSTLDETRTVRAPQNIHQDDINLALTLMTFPKIINDAQRNNMPNTVANYIESLTQQCNSYYGKHSLKDSDDSLFLFRYSLIQSCNTVIQNGLHLLNIKTLDRM